MMSLHVDVSRSQIPPKEIKKKKFNTKDVKISGIYQSRSISACRKKIKIFFIELLTTSGKCRFFFFFEIRGMM